MSEVRFVDTTFRDGSQSLWAMGMRGGMMEVVAGTMAQAGFDVIEVPVNAIYLKKLLRDLKEDPWEFCRMLVRTMPHTVKSCMAGGFIQPFEAPAPRSVIELFYSRLAAIGVLNRAQLTCNTFDQCKRQFPWIIPLFRNLGMKIAIALSYTISPRHTDSYYGEKVREVMAFKPDAIYLKDQGGVLTLDRVRTLLPVIVRNSAGVPVELHSHCTTGLAPLVYLEALKLGVKTLHTGIPPLANGAAQPSVFNVAANARLLGYQPQVNDKLLVRVSERLTAIAKQEKLPVGVPLQYDYAQYVHQIPGGVISNLKHQLNELRMADRLPEVIEESVRVRRDLGYPIMITPHSQFMVTQSAINVAVGERYKHVIDELIMFAQGIYGEDSGYPWMDQNLKDRLLAMPRAKELAARKVVDVPLKEIRAHFGGAAVSDEEFLLRYIMKGVQEIEAMRAAGPPRRYYNRSAALATLVQELAKQRRVRYVHFERGGSSVTVGSRSSV